MSSVEGWIDVEAVRRMAQQLVDRPKAGSRTDSSDPGFGPGFEGFLTQGAPSVNSLPAPAVGVMVEVNPPETEPSLPPEPEPEEKTHPQPTSDKVAEQDVRSHEDDAPKPFLTKALEEPPAVVAEEEHVVELSDEPGPEERDRGPLVARLEKFRRWMESKVGAKGIFVLDREGEPIIDDEDFTKLHFLARSLAQAYRPVAGETGNVHVKVGAASYLVVVPVETDFGTLVLGAVLSQALDANAVSVVARGLGEAVRPQRD